jgi:hypothetical protein
MKNKKQTKWTSFMDITPDEFVREFYEMVYIEAPKSEALVVFYNRFGYNEYKTSVVFEDSLEQLTGFHRKCTWDEKNVCYDTNTGISISEYEKQPDVLMIRADEINDEEKIGDLPAKRSY